MRAFHTRRQCTAVPPPPHTHLQVCLELPDGGVGVHQRRRQRAVLLLQALQDVQLRSTPQAPRRRDRGRGGKGGVFVLPHERAL